MKYFITFFLCFLLYSCSEDKAWSKISATGPVERSSSFGFVDELNRFVIVGGKKENQSFKDVWALNLSKKKWEEIPVNNISLEEGEKLNYSVFNEGTLYLAGSYKDGQAVPINIYKWEVYSNVWQKMNTESGASLRGHTAVLLKDTSFFGEPVIVIFGGQDPSSKVQNGINIFRLETKLFETIEVSGELPKARMNHSTVISNNNKMIIFGGKNDVGILNDMWEFDFSNKMWTKISDADIDLAYGRTTLFDKDDNSIIFYGGKNDKSEPVSGFYIYSINSKKWDSIDSSDGPGARFGISAAITSGNDIIFFGGIQKNGTEFIEKNDIWKYNR